MTDVALANVATIRPGLHRTLDVAILERIVAERLPDLDAFADAVTRHLATQGPPVAR